jgi:phosphoribosylformylglycinamidine (FGAM) synthase-like enzyme
VDQRNKKALAMETDCNGRYIYLNYKGAIAVCESQNAAGTAILLATNCLNFGNP